ncbi:MAG: enoyl-CoA hydratase/carnithine racemase [Candidatus Azotimanducaceae bacterium]
MKCDEVPPDDEEDPMTPDSTPAFETLEVAVEGMNGRLTLNRPEKLNPLSTRTLRELADAARWFDTQRQVKTVIVSGKGRAFSAGADISSFGDVASNDGLSPRDSAETGWLMARAMEEMRAVTIAAIWGPCVGGGIVLAGACDFRIAARDTYFSIPEVDLGIPLAWGGIPRLVREIGPAATRDLVMTCRPFTADEAAGLGFLNSVLDAHEVLPAAEKLAMDLGRKSGLALYATKTGINAALEAMSPASGSWSDADSLVVALGDPESRRLSAEYLERVRK